MASSPHSSLHSLTLPDPSCSPPALSTVALSPAPLSSFFYGQHSTSLLLSLSLLPLHDVVSAALVCREWFAVVARDSQQLAWRWQQDAERRKYRMQPRRQSIAAHAAAAAATATAGGATEAHATSTLSSIEAAAPESAALASLRASLLREDEDEAHNIHFPFGAHCAALETCRSVLLRATARAYFLRQGMGLLPLEEQRAESPIMTPDAGLLRPSYAWPSALTSSLPASAPLLTHVRHLKLSLHAPFNAIWCRFLSALPCLTHLGLVVTNLWPVESAAVRDAFARLGNKRNPLLSLNIQFMELEEGRDRARSRAGSSATMTGSSSGGASSPVSPMDLGPSALGASSTFHWPVECPASLRTNYLAITSALAPLRALRTLVLQGVTDALDTENLAWLSDAATRAPAFPNLMLLSLPPALSKSAPRIFSLRSSCPQLAELRWPPWTSPLNLTLLLSTAGRERAMEEAERLRARAAAREAGAPVDRGDPASANSLVASYVPPPLRIPVPRFCSFALEGALSDVHLRTLHCLAPTLKKLILREDESRPGMLNWALLSPLTDGILRNADGEPLSAGEDPLLAPPPLAGQGGLEELLIDSPIWSAQRLISLQAAGRWPRLRRLHLNAPVYTSNSTHRPPSHPLSISNSEFHPATFWARLGASSTLVSLTLEGLELTSLGCIAPSSNSSSSSSSASAVGSNPSPSMLRTLRLIRISGFSPRNLRALLNLRRTLRHLILDRVSSVNVEHLDAILPQQPARGSASSSHIAGLVSPRSVREALELETFHFSLAADVYGAYVRDVAEYTRLHPREASHAMLMPPFADDLERAVPLAQRPSARCVDRWTQSKLRVWRLRMEQRDEPMEDGGVTAPADDDAPPRLSVWFSHNSQLPKLHHSSHLLASSPVWMPVERE